MGGDLSKAYGREVDALNEKNMKEDVEGRRVLVYEPFQEGDVVFLREMLQRSDRLSDKFMNKEMLMNKLSKVTENFNALTNEESCDLLTNLCKAALTPESKEQYALLQREGVNGRNMVMIETGKAHLSIKKKAVRYLKTPVTYIEWIEQGGDAVSDLDCGPYGFMELLYDQGPAPNVRATTEKLTLWRIVREDFHRILSVMEDGIALQRARWLCRCPEINQLDDANIKRLVANLQVENFKKGDKMMSRKRMTSKFIMVETGECVLSLPMEVIPREKDMSRKEMDHALSIVRPPGLDTLRCVKDMNPHMLLRYLECEGQPDVAVVEQDPEHDEGKSVDQAVGDDDNETRSASTSNLTRHNEEVGPLPGERIAHDPYAPPLPPHQLLVTPGCILGIDALRSKIRQSQIEFWQWKPSHFADEMYTEEVQDDGQSFPGSEIPFSLVAATDVQVVSFSVDLLDGLFGSVDRFARGEVSGGYDSDGEREAITSARSALSEYDEHETEEGEEKAGRAEEKYSGEHKSAADDDDFKDDSENDDEIAANMGNINVHVFGRFAVKVFPLTSKHEGSFKRERRVLHRLQRDNLFMPLICKPTAAHMEKEETGRLKRLIEASLTLVTEHCGRGDVWRLIHRPPQDIPHTYEDPYLANFYFAQTLVAVAKLHRLNYVWRGVCPENIGVDMNGNARLLDVSMCGDVSNERLSGDQRRTLCGSPEFMAPEMILGRGHGKAVDVWALGVLLHELYWGYTPFGEGGKESLEPSLRYHNDAAKLERILRSVREIESTLSMCAEVAARDPTKAHPMAAALVLKMVRPRPAERLGYLHPDGPMNIIDNTNLFDALELDLLETGRLRPPYTIPYQTT